MSHIEASLFSSWKGTGAFQFERLRAAMWRHEPLFSIQCVKRPSSRAYVITCKHCNAQISGSYGTWATREDKLRAMSSLTEFFLFEELSQSADGLV